MYEKLTSLLGNAQFKYCSIKIGKENFPIVFLLHGLFSNRHSLDRLGSFLYSKGYTTIACDARGHGSNEGFVYEWDKTVEEYHHRINSFGSRRIIVIGHSMGAIESIALAKNPHVKQVFAISPAYDSSIINSMNILHQIFLAINIPPLTRRYLEYNKLEVIETYNFKKEIKELENEYSELEKIEKLIDEILESTDESSKLKSLESSIKVKIEKLRQSLILRKLQIKQDILMNLLYDKNWYKRLIELKEDIQEHLKLKQYYIGLKMAVEDLFTHIYRVDEVMPKNIELSPEETEKIYIIASRFDMIIPSEHVRKIIEKFQIPNERVKYINMFHGFTDETFKTRKFIEQNILKNSNE